MKDSEFQKVWAGQPIRFPVEEKGHFVPASVEHWIKTFTIPVDDGGAGINAPKAPAPKAGKEGASLPERLPKLAATSGASAGSEWFGDVPNHSIGCDCGLHPAQNSGPGK